MQGSGPRFVGIALIFGLAVACSSSDDGGGAPNGSPGEAPDDRPAEAIPSSGELAKTCDDADPNQECAEPARDALQLDDMKALGIVEVDPTGSQGEVVMTLTPDSRLRPHLKVGQTLMRGGDKPFLRKILEVEQRGDRFRLKTARASVRDIYKKARIRRRFAAGAERSEGLRPRNVGIDGPIGVVTQPLKTTLGLPDCTFSFNPNVSGVDVKLEATKCAFTFTPSIDVIWDWDLFSPDTLEIAASGSIVADLTMHAEIAAAVAKTEEKRLTTLLVPIPLPIPISLNLNFELFGGYKIDVDATITADAGFSYDATASAGIGYAKGDGFYTFFETSKNYTSTGPTITVAGGGYAKAWVRPKLSLEVFGVLDGYIDAEMYAKLNLEQTSTTVVSEPTGSVVEGETCVELVAGIKPSLGISADIFGINLGDPIDTQLPSIKKTIVPEACVPFQNVTSTCAANAACQFDSDCPAPDACHLPSCSTDCQCNTALSRPIEGCCLTNADCGTPPSGSTYVCSFNQCALIPQLTATCFMNCCSNTDCDDGLDLTTDTCEQPNTIYSECVHNLTKPPLGGGTKLGGLTTQTFGDGAVGKACARDKECDDGNPKTADDCFARRCRHRPARVLTCEETCDDQNPMTRDRCENGVCTHAKYGKDGLPFPR